MESKEKNGKQIILQVAARLFLEKGFDSTSMQDIVRESGMSKGGIYHYFKSKEDILQTVQEMQNELIQQQITHLKEHNGMEAKARLQSMLAQSFCNQDNNKGNGISGILKSPEYALKSIKDNIEAYAPIFSEVIKEGNEDGSCSTRFPEEVAEVFLLLLNFWCDPMIFHADIKKQQSKIVFIQYMMKQFGVDIISDDMIALLCEGEN